MTSMAEAKFRHRDDRPLRAVVGDILSGHNGGSQARNSPTIHCRTSPIVPTPNHNDAKTDSIVRVTNPLDLSQDAQNG